ncbi:hypothetical protein GRI72_11520 [Altererythrobacter marinus]|uniref:Uncharacterized protein n=1 Tax=Pelagerythrobacter marinus TaxID=538382 RepID=A0ABW9UZW3_9SPHN|nr:hypothetical protein [Pelagerythrobacter marinus]MXO69449.1 hypothetical protein [Pelagerythrobacter marinus]
MLISVLLVAHIAVLGYWLGSEFVINSTYRYVSYGSQMPFAERDRLMDHVMHVDQHVRYALVLQAGLGFALAALYGYVPGGTATAWAAGILAALWLTFVEIVHRLRHSPAGKRLGDIDRGSRYLFMALLVAIAVGLIGGGWDMPFWLRVKLGLFACVMASGVGIRLALISHFRTWAVMAREGPTDETNAIIRRTYWRATSVLLVLWAFIGAIVVMSVWKPA